MMDDARWTLCAPSEYVWEGSALAYLKSVIPDREPYRAWANAQFIGADGSVNEIDLLLIAPGPGRRRPDRSSRTCRRYLAGW
jgi:hypothetical protein